MSSKVAGKADTMAKPVGKANLRVVGRTQWSKFPSFNAEGKQDPLELELSIATDMEELTVPFNLSNVAVVAEK